MARGSVVGEKIVSQANTAAFTDGYARIFGDRKPVRGRWVMDQSGRLVSAEDYRPQPEARNALIIADRIHEGTKSPIDGSDIGSRRKRREHNARHGVADRSDYGPGWRERKDAERERRIDKATDGAMDAAARDMYRRGREI